LRVVRIQQQHPWATSERRKTATTQVQTKMAKDSGRFGVLSTIVAHKGEREAQAESFLYLKRPSRRHGRKGYGLGVL
jgi:hypothetical protein